MSVHILQINRLRRESEQAVRLSEERLRRLAVEAATANAQFRAFFDKDLRRDHAYRRARSSSPTGLSLESVRIYPRPGRRQARSGSVPGGTPRMRSSSS